MRLIFGTIGGLILGLALISSQLLAQDLGQELGQDLSQDLATGPVNDSDVDPNASSKKTYPDPELTAKEKTDQALLTLTRLVESADFNALYLPIGPSYEITNEKLIVKYGVKFDSRGFFQIMKTLGQTLDAISLEKELVPFSDAVVRSNKELAQGKLTSNVRPYFLDYPRPDPPYKTIFVPINTNSIVVYLVDKETIDAFNNLLYTKYNKGEPFNLNLMDVNCALEISAGGKVIDLYSDIVTIDAVIDSSADSLSFTPFLFNKDAIPPTLKLEAVKEFPLQDFNIDHTNIHNQIKTKLSINISYR